MVKLSPSLPDILPWSLDVLNPSPPNLQSLPSPQLLPIPHPHFSSTSSRFSNSESPKASSDLHWPTVLESRAPGKGRVSAVTLLLSLCLPQHCSHPLSTRDGRARQTAWDGQEVLGWGAPGEFGLEIGPRSAHTHPSMALFPPCCCFPKGRWPESPCPWTHRYEEWNSLVVRAEWGGPLLFQDPQTSFPRIIPFFHHLPFVCPFLLPISCPPPLQFNPERS